MGRTRTSADRIARDVDYWTLAELRYHIRRFLRVREDAARAAGIEPQQYQLLLQIKGLQGRRPPTVGALAERLQLRHHSTVELIDRLVDRGMLVRRPGGRDRRQVVIELRPAGEAVMRRLALYSLRELEAEGPALATALRRLTGASALRKRRGLPQAAPKADGGRVRPAQVRAPRGSSRRRVNGRTRPAR